MLTKVQKWGNSQGLRFSKEILKEAQVKVGDDVEVSVKGRKIIIEPAKRSGEFDLRDLVSRMTKDYVAQEIDWGAPAGKEVW